MNAMADDAREIMGKWTVRIKAWVWEYEFSQGGKVTWRDTRGTEKGVGRWSLAPAYQPVLDRLFLHGKLAPAHSAREAEGLV